MSLDWRTERSLYVLFFPFLISRCGSLLMTHWSLCSWWTFLLLSLLPCVFRAFNSHPSIPPTLLLSRPTLVFICITFVHYNLSLFHCFVYISKHKHTILKTLSHITTNYQYQWMFHWSTSSTNPLCYNKCKQLWWYCTSAYWWSEDQCLQEQEWWLNNEETQTHNLCHQHTLSLLSWHQQGANIRLSFSI